MCTTLGHTEKAGPALSATCVACRPEHSILRVNLHVEVLGCSIAVHHTRAHQQGVHEGLRVYTADLYKQVLQGLYDERILDVDASHELWDCNQPCVHWHSFESTFKLRTDIIKCSVSVPQREQPQHILQGSTCHSTR